ncbi:TetR/AcrR family transcriptional regulator [Nocardia sp. NBC_00565]|uniref:TetR/AcrR family transcriptional regulator n=1 Tax=Nocardia sp. NBC_00565 TaxID=2975993 RepID=UPI002E8092EB|nr:TetR/AcrR family transcriptional regulator [Nocardia sp. NBC_00565]WUC07026.1 TetR/AcrR family transcriptional regulator [Nocardia sp. NBC_00565]
MGRLSRAEQQEITRGRVLDAAKVEFTERGFRGSTVDGIADRAELTRGAVYSNFPGKRALYFAVLAREAEQAPAPSAHPAGATPAAALGMFASTWAERLPRSNRYAYTASEQRLSSPVLSIDLIPEIQGDERIRWSFSQLMKLDAILLGATLGALDQQRGAPQRFLRIAESVLTILYGATQLSFAAPDFVDPAHVVGLCEQIASLESVDDAPAPPHEVTGPHPQYVNELWSPPICFDMLRNTTARPDGDRVVTVLGMHRIAAIQHLIALSPPHTDITLALVTDDRTGELAPLARLALADFSRSLRYAFPDSALPDIQVIVDESGAIPTACGLESVDDNTEAAVVISAGRITLRASGPDACHTAFAASPERTKV